MVPSAVEPEEPTSVVVLHDVGWDLFEQILAARGERSMPRIAYLDGELELMTTSREHEVRSRMLARLLFAYAEESGVALNAYGSFTMKKRPRKSGIEPDECFNLHPAGEWPDLAIEVEWSRARVDKLEIYRRFGVREVWRWNRDRVVVHALREQGYVEVASSELLPDLDLALLARHVLVDDQTAATVAYRAALRERL
jgi:Uma2 family endonuclease